MEEIESFESFRMMWTGDDVNQKLGVCERKQEIFIMIMRSSFHEIQRCM